MQKLLEDILSKEAIVGIVGMGYVGSALADLIAEKEFSVIGFDINQKRVDSINKQRKKFLRATVNIEELQTCNIILICVQTPVHEDKTPDLRILQSATQSV